MARSNVTIAHVARDAGVSTATVSRALNQGAAVSPDTRARVMASVKRLGFVLNPTARALRRRETRRILVPVPTSANAVLASVLQGMNSVFHKAGYSTLVIDTDGQGVVEEVLNLVQRREMDAIAAMDAKFHDGLLAVAGDLPLIYASEWPSDPAASFVKSDNREGGRMAADHLIELGHKSIGQLSGAAIAPMARERRDGFCDQIRHRGLVVDPDWQLYSRWDMNDALTLAQRVIATRARGQSFPTGWFFASDEMALAFMGELLKNGVSIPGEVSIVGFDDIPAARYLHPALTTVRQDPRALGSTAATALLDQLDGQATGTPVQVNVPVDLVVRASTGRAPDSMDIPV